MRAGVLWLGLSLSAAPASAAWTTGDAPPTIAADSASPDAVSGTSAPAAWPTSVLAAPLKIKPREKAVSSDGRKSALILREEMDTKGTIRCEKLILRVDDGSAADRVLIEVPQGLWGVKWSPDGTFVACHHRVSDRDGCVLVVNTTTGVFVDAGADALRLVSESGGFAHAIYFSPDSKSLLLSCHPPVNPTPVTPAKAGALFIVDAATGFVRKRVEWE